MTILFSRAQGLRPLIVALVALASVTALLTGMLVYIPSKAASTAAARDAIRQAIKSAVFIGCLSFRTCFCGSPLRDPQYCGRAFLPDNG